MPRKQYRLPHPSEVDLAGPKLQERLQGLTPAWKEIHSAFPDAKVNEQDDGQKVVRVEGRENVLKLSEMFGPRRQVETAHGLEQSARQPEVTMQTPSGRRMVVKEKDEERTGRKFGAHTIRRRPWTLRGRGNGVLMDRSGRRFRMVSRWPRPAIMEELT